ncbi:MAG: hypothetical protein J7K04_12465 [Spirochaetales bacterium]|nr:hypothetical protein [Spirochaetales bacterium]
MISYNNYNFDITREPLVRPFHFKGSFFTEKWLNSVTIFTKDNKKVSAIGGNAILWSDPKVFFAHSESGGNILMSAMVEKALTTLCGKEFLSPIDAFNFIFPKLHAFGKKITENYELRETFTLNSLVSIDFALWKLFAAEKGITSFYDLIPEKYRIAFPARQKKLARIPLITYNLPDKEIVNLASSGHFIFKIKIGHPGKQFEMLEKDLKRIEHIHSILKNFRTEYTENSKPAYYFDANGRYESKELFLKLMDGLEKLNILDCVMIIEEPFPDGNNIEVRDIPVRIAADESLNGIGDIKKKAGLGYKAIALKPAGKTLSISIMMAFEAYKEGIPCFVADSACIPLLLDWNRNVASLLPSFPGIAFSMIESNGAQYYRNWSTMINNHPCSGNEWLKPHNGLFHLNDQFYDLWGCVLK